ncbi:MAG: TRADD-N-associated membrane domain-containing protein [Candidatus Electrothrix sp. YB6]
MNNLITTLSSSVALLLSVLGLVVVVLTYLRRGRIKFGQFQLEFAKEQIHAGGDIHIHQLQSTEEIPEEPAHRQYSLMQQYHSQGLAQAKISFWFSLVFASLGFIVIIVSLLTMDNQIALTSQGKTFVGLISGTIIDAVSALFFVQSNKARHLMTEFFDKLRVDRRFEESLQICERIPDQITQSRLKVLMALNFAEVSSSESILREVLANHGDLVGESGENIKRMHLTS